MSGESSQKRRPPWYFGVGSLSFLSVHGMMIAGIEPISTYFFVFVWWSYVVLIDSLIFWQRGSSLFSQLGIKILILALFSYLFWEFFELINLRINNWSYIGYSFGPAGGIVFKVLAFGSVLLGVLETHNLLQLLSLGRRLEFLRWEQWGIFLKRKWWGRPHYLWITIGVTMLVLSLTWPYYFFWTIWIALIFILDPDVEMNGGKSLSAELREGNMRTLYRLSVAGLVCGILWEGWNYWAGLKWVYSVPIVGGWKIFEMPILGYLGFPVFAVECYVFYQWLGCQKRRLQRLRRLFSRW